MEVAKNSSTTGAASYSSQRDTQGAGSKLTIVVANQVSLHSEDLLDSLFGMTINALRLRPGRDRLLDLLDRRIRFLSKDLPDVGERDHITRTPPADVESVPNRAYHTLGLLLEVLPYGLEVDESVDTERTEYGRVSDPRELQKRWSL